MGVPKAATTIMGEVIDLTGSELPEKVAFQVMGKPQAEPRARMGPYGMYYPNGPRRTAFRQFIMRQVPETARGPVFPAGVSVAVVVRCYLRRPNTDFKRGDRLGHMLKAMVPSARPVVPDIDNMAKFILDAMNGLVYKDDRQVVHLVVSKLLDNEGACEGRTEVEVTQYKA